MDVYDHYKLCQKVGITNDHLIAWVEKNPENNKVLKFTEDVLYNRGLQDARLFNSVDEAKQWLAN